MPQSVLVQVGQCGNQVGFRFWESTMKEYTAYRDKLTDEQMCYFLRPKTDMMPDKPLDECYTARGILVDMEEGVISAGCRGTLRNLFNKQQILTDVSGSGNNWAKGNKYYAKYHSNKIEEILYKEAEGCDKLESFIFIFSMGGGTGSGLGTAIVETVKTIFPGIPRLAFPVYPSLIDDVITSPYNAVLANSKLSEHADLIIPFENQVLSEICLKIEKNKSKFHLRGKQSLAARLKTAKLSGTSERIIKPFDDMNDLIASVISDFTSCARLPGTLNIDINELILNMTPYPKLKYIIPSTSPFILVPEDMKMERVFADLFTSSHSLLRCDMSDALLLSAAVLARGAVSLVELQDNLNKFRSNLKFTGSHDPCIKTGLCDHASANRCVSLLKVVNSCSIAENLVTLKETFQKMYNKKAHLHHFMEVDNMENSDFHSALTAITDVVNDYREISGSNNVIKEPPRLKLV